MVESALSFPGGDSFRGGRRKKIRDSAASPAKLSADHTGIGYQTKPFSQGAGRVRSAATTTAATPGSTKTDDSAPEPQSQRAYAFQPQKEDCRAGGNIFRVERTDDYRKQNSEEEGL